MVQRNLKGGFPEEIMVKKTHKRWEVFKHRVKRKNIPHNITESVVKLKWQFGSNWRVLNHKWLCSVQFSSVTQSCLTLCNPIGLQHARLPCPSSTPGAYSDSCPSSQWCHPTISSSVIHWGNIMQW